MGHGNYRQKGQVEYEKYQSGYDGINFQYKIGLDGIKDLDFEGKKPNTAKKSIVEFQGKGGLVSGYINPAHQLYADNRKPFGIVDAIKLEVLKNDVLEYLKNRLQEQLQDKYSDEYIQKLRITRIEVNITLPCVGKATPYSQKNNSWDCFFYPAKLSPLYGTPALQRLEISKEYLLQSSGLCTLKPAEGI